MGPKKVLILTGSPRRGGNTDLLAEAFARGAKEAGHEVVIYETAHEKIKGCRACDRCFTTGKACIFDDDGFNKLAALLLESDAVAFAVPLYWYNFPAQMKAALDRTYSFFHDKRFPAIKKSVLMTCAGEDDPACFDALVATYKLIAGHFGWDYGTPLLAPGLYGAGEIQYTDFLNQAERLGREL